MFKPTRGVTRKTATREQNETRFQEPLAGKESEPQQSPPATGEDGQGMQRQVPCSVVAAVHGNNKEVTPHRVVRRQTTGTKLHTGGHRVRRNHLASVRWAVKQLTGYRFNDQGSKVTSSITGKLGGECDTGDHTLFGYGPRIDNVISVEITRLGVSIG